MSEAFVIFDTEYTTWDGAQDRGWSGENEYRELVQIAAIKVDKETLEEIDTLDVLVMPQFNTTLSDFFTELTGITNDEINKRGLSFDGALKKFNNFSNHLVIFSYGNDLAILAENLGLYKNKSMYLAPSYFKNWADFFYRADIKTKKINSGRLAQHFGVEGNIKGREHNALYDCRSQLEAFKCLYQKGHNFLF